MDNHIVPPDQLLESMKTGPYKTTAHAIAELIDNSADALAKEIGVVLIVDKDSLKPHTIAVLDNGIGMDETVLKHCLQWGFHGEHEILDNKENQKRLGKFGVGLVAASFSQCSDVQVLSWQNNEISTDPTVPSTRLSLLNDSAALLQNILPEPSRCAIPNWAISAFQGMPTPISAMPHGTLVIWRDVDTRNRAQTLQTQLVALCGRIHRNLIQHSTKNIVVNVFNEDSGEIQPVEATPVDPTFLSNWSVPELSQWGFVGDTTLFQPYTGHIGDTGMEASGIYQGQLINVPHGSTDEEAIGVYHLTASYRSDRVTDDQQLQSMFSDPGDAPYGKLANRLKGVSILREGREIDLDPSWLRPDRTVDRWLSVSVDFDSKLDSIFGVSHDKQQVRGLAELASRSIEELNEEIKTLRQSGTTDDSDFLERLFVAWNIKDQLRKMQRLVRLQRKDVRTPPVGPPTTDPTVASTPELVDVGNRMVDGDREIPMDTKSPADDPEATRDAYEESMSGDRKAREVRPQEVEEHGLRLDYARDPYATPAEMFHIKVGNHMVVHFHEQHPLSDSMVRLLVPSEGDEPPTIQDALKVVRGLIASYARVMAEADRYDETESIELRRCLLSWSGKARAIFRDSDD